MTPEGWNVKNMGQVLERIAESVDVDPEGLYQEIGIRSHGKGIFHKEKVNGIKLGNKRVFWVQSECFVVNIVFAWEQAVAKTTKNECGMIASHRFPMYRPKEGKCDVDFITYYFKTLHGKYLLGLASPGGAGRNKTLGQKEFSNLKMLMPSGKEQKKIAQILSVWDKSIETVELLIEKSKLQKKALMQQLLTGKRRFNAIANNKWIETKIRNIAEINPTKPKKPKDGNVSFVPMGSVSINGKIITSEIRNYDDVAKGFTSFIDNDVLIAKITPCFENGKGGYVTSLHNGIGFGSTEFHVLRAKENIDSKFVCYITRTHEFMFRGETNMQGSAGQRRVPTDFIKNYKVKIPRAFDEQKRISDVLTTLDLEIDNQIEQKKLLNEQKKSLMQQLLTGKRRVKLDEAEEPISELEKIA